MSGESSEDDFIVLPDESEKIKKIIRKLLESKTIFDDKLREIDCQKRSYECLVNNAIETCLSTLNQKELADLQIDGSFINFVTDVDNNSEESVRSLLKLADKLKKENEILKARIRIYDQTIERISSLHSSESPDESLFSKTVSILERHREVIQQDFNRNNSIQNKDTLINEKQDQDMRPSVCEMIDEKIKSSIDQKMDVVKAYFETILAKIEIPPNNQSLNSNNRCSSTTNSNFSEIGDKIKRMPKLTTLQAHYISVEPENEKDPNQWYKESFNQANHDDNNVKLKNFHIDDSNVDQTPVTVSQPHAHKPNVAPSTSENNYVNKLSKTQFNESNNSKGVNNVTLPSNMPKCEPPSYDAHMKRNDQKTQNGQSSNNNQQKFSSSGNLNSPKSPTSSSDCGRQTPSSPSKNRFSQSSTAYAFSNVHPVESMTSKFNPYNTTSDGTQKPQNSSNTINNTNAYYVSPTLVDSNGHAKNPINMSNCPRNTPPMNNNGTSAPNFQPMQPKNFFVPQQTFYQNQQPTHQHSTIHQQQQSQQQQQPQSNFQHVENKKLTQHISLKPSYLLTTNQSILWNFFRWKFIIQVFELVLHRISSARSREKEQITLISSNGFL